MSLRVWLGAARLFALAFALYGCQRETKSVATREASASASGSAAKPGARPSASASAGAPSAARSLDDARRLVALFGELGRLHEAKAGDCAALVVALREFRRAHERELAAAAAVYRAIEADPALSRSMHAAMESVMTASMKCREHADFRALVAEPPIGMAQ